MEPQSEAAGKLRILILEDVASDAELMERALREAGLAFTALKVDTREPFLRALDEFSPEIVLADYKLPDFDGLEALKAVQQKKPGLPLILVTGALGHEAALQVVKAGAADYVLKGELARLPFAVERAVATVRVERDRRAAERVRERLAAIVEASADAIIGADMKGMIMSWNRGAERMFGYLSAEAIGKPAGILVPRDRASEVTDILSCVGRGEVVEEIETERVRKDGGRLWVGLSAAPWREGDGAIVGVSVVERDITERRLQRLELEKLNRTLTILGQGNGALVHAQEEKSLLEEMCRIIAEVGGYQLVWVGYVQPGPGKAVKPAAYYGQAGVLLERLVSPAPPSPEGELSALLRSGVVELVNEIATDPRAASWREEAAGQGWRSMLALPLQEDSKGLLGALVMVSSRCAAFDAGEIEILRDLAGDLAYGISTLRMRQARDRALGERQTYLDRLNSVLEEAVATVASTTEMRDPYTANHQRRVAELCSAIARELGLPEDRRKGLSLAAAIHDIGKIAIPAEILSRPAALGPFELSLVRDHPRNGYEAVKKVSFPWPIAEIVLQHHERLDGSGYPQGLKQDQIIEEARILAVADVVEAMSSHRPYRAALGVDAALDEITTNRDRLYDARIVDACVSLFRKKGFRFLAGGR